MPAREKPPEKQRSLTIAEWCDKHRLNRAFFYLLDKRGQAPSTYHVGSRRLITPEADAAWLAAREAAGKSTAA